MASRQLHEHHRCEEGARNRIRGGTKATAHRGPVQAEHAKQAKAPKAKERTEKCQKKCAHWNRQRSEDTERICETRGEASYEQQPELKSRRGVRHCHKTPMARGRSDGLELSGSTRRQAPLSRRARRVLSFARGVTDGVLPCGKEPDTGPRVRTPVLSAAAKG